MAVIGLDRFREHFAAFNDRYALIGGTACFLAMDQVGLEFRATKDLDVVLIIENLDQGFAAAIKAFVVAGGYGVNEREAKQRRFYRFARPTVAGYPVMLELFARVDDALPDASGQSVGPVFKSVDAQGEALSLSAILLDDTYYAWICAGRVTIGGLPIVRPEHLIPLKARAWLDLTARRDAGDRVDSSDISKHKNDVFRLYRILDPEYTVGVPAGISSDVHAFLDRMKRETLDLRALKIPTPASEVLALLRQRYAGSA